MHQPLTTRGPVSPDAGLGAVRVTLPVFDVDTIDLSVHRDPREIAGLWREFERTALRSIYQRYDWLESWCDNAAPALGIEPTIVVGSDGGRPLFVLPVGRDRTRLGRVLVWLGGTHVNSGMALFDRAFARTLTERSTRRLFRRVLAAIGKVDFVSLGRQPFQWEDAANPLRHLGGKVEDQPILTIALDEGFDAVLARRSGARKRKKLRWQENTLKPVGGYRYGRARTRDEAYAVLDAFLAQKGEQFARSGIDNVFAEPGAAAFFRGLIDNSFDHGTPVIELYSVEIEGKIRATFAAGVDHDRFQGYFSAISLDEWQRISPGELLLFHMMRECCQRGFKVLDFGMGEERYKSSWDGQPQAQFAVIAGVTLQGRVVARTLRTAQKLKLAIRSNPRAWSVVKKVRRGVASLRGRKPEAAAPAGED